MRWGYLLRGFAGTSLLVALAGCTVGHPGKTAHQALSGSKTLQVGSASTAPAGASDGYSTPVGGTGAPSVAGTSPPASNNVAGRGPASPRVPQLSASWVEATYQVAGTATASQNGSSGSTAVQSTATLSQPGGNRLALYWPMLQSDAGTMLTFSDTYGDYLSRLDITIPSGRNTVTFSFTPDNRPIAWMTLPVGSAANGYADADRYKIIASHPKSMEWDFDFAPNQNLTGAWANAQSGYVRFALSDPGPPWSTADIAFYLTGSSGTLSGNLSFKLEHVEN